MRELTLLFAPHINSYKRFARGSFAPTAVAWGNDNRTCSMRVVGHGAVAALREPAAGRRRQPVPRHRAMIAAGLHGIDNELELEPAFEGNAYESDKPRVPTTLRDARDLFAGSEVAREAFGEEVVDHYLNRARRGARGVRVGGHRLGAVAGVRATVSSRRRSSRAAVIGLHRLSSARRWAAWEELADAAAAASYVAAVQRAGGLALLLPPDAAARPSRTRCSTCSTGCCSPAAPTSTRPPTGPSRTRDQGTLRPRATRFEIALARAALERDMPLLGVCRGMQMMNVAAGGTLHPAPARRTSATSAPPHARRVRRPRGAPRAGLARRARGRAPSARRSSRTTTRASTGSATAWWSRGWRRRRRRRRGDRAARQALRARRAVAPRGGRGQPRDRGASWREARERRGVARDDRGHRAGDRAGAAPSSRRPAWRRPTPRSRARRPRSRRGAR